jgi:hypothetical protein
MDAAAADRYRDSHAWFDDATQSSQLTADSGRRVFFGHALEHLTHRNQARERRHERELSDRFKDVRD